MSLMHASAEPARLPTSTGRVMAWLLLATLPGIATLAWYFGWGVLTNVLAATAFAVALEALVLKLRGRSPTATLSDNSALVTGVLLGVSLPPGSSWWLILVGVVAAIVIAKQLFGGLGHNPFNPAMVGYALLLVAFPLPMTQWAAPHGLFGPEATTLPDALRLLAGLTDPLALDGMSGATPLDAFKHKPEAVMASEFWASSPLPEGTMNAWHSVSLAWLVGGALLLYKRLIGWHIPVAMLGAMAVIAALLYGVDPSHYGSPLFHLLGGAAIFGAFFIATDPVSAATSRKGKLYYGAGVGVLVMLIRTTGAYPDAVAFAVLLMNFAVPFIDYYTQPRTYGHHAPTRGIKVKRLEDETEEPR
ncbi:electron transport complex subunit RsxD [Litchfieldella qijiaojingensis]|uniref:Ion-translocating oxidoreductase complex subunit D n=1 Tax=Litchfieldella qijiaojingensis TaxID=980347 RepID=A0ABQ2Z9J9_9GAMM|nr:RnfABCDGE type electron transport complex subunit D [Halomonas qijiaojingensis]GGY06959.1 electron transport complex subunit RsxD [Halomonas qijiaojingensis]